MINMNGGVSNPAPCKDSTSSALVSLKSFKNKLKLLKLKSGQFPVCVFIAPCVCTIIALYTSVKQVFSSALHPAHLRYL